MSGTEIDLQLAYFGRGLSKERLTAINAALPDTRAFRLAALTFNPSFIAMECAPGSGRERLPTAAICLQDVAHALSEARYAEAQASLALEVWRLPGGSLRVAIAQAQYYCADAAHRLYAAGEHIATAILCIRDLDEKALNPGKVERAVSLQARLARHLKTMRPSDPITAAVLKLGATQAWRRSIEYRGDWVHDQAPILDGIGQLFDRHATRWHTMRGPDGAEIGHQLSVGGGDPSESTIDAVLSDAVAATAAFLELTAVVVEEYVTTLAAIGVRVNIPRGQTSITIFSAADDTPDDATAD
jgi:hypothetical protein